MSSPHPLEDGLQGTLLEGEARSIVELTQALVRERSQTGIDSPEPAMRLLMRWLKEHGVEPALLESEGEPVAVVAVLEGSESGPTICLNACIDTAPVGAIENWSVGPFGGEIEDGWMYGRGSADSKAGLAIFAHILSALGGDGLPRGRLVLVADGDEHTGHFRGVRAYTGAYGPPSAALIGYPGIEKIHIGARGFWRAQLVVYGTSAHSGSRVAAKNAVAKAAELALTLNGLSLQPSSDSSFGVPPRSTVTEIVGGTGYTQVPDVCLLRVDVRLTPSFDAARARNAVREAVDEIDSQLQYGRATEIREEKSWPAYKLSRGSPLVQALHRAAALELGSNVPFAVAGPSNVGNYFARLGVDAVCGFGVRCEGVHARDEKIDLRTVPAVWHVYRNVVAELLALEAPRKADTNS